jgi:hypothetical protein
MFATVSIVVASTWPCLPIPERPGKRRKRRQINSGQLSSAKPKTIAAAQNHRSSSLLPLAQTAAGAATQSTGEAEYDTLAIQV